MSEILEWTWRQTGKDPLSRCRHSMAGYYEILQVIAGDGSFFIHDKVHTFNSDMLFLIDMSYIHCSSPRAPQQYVRNKLIVSEKLVRELLEAARSKGLEKTLFCANGVRVRLNTSTSAFIDALFERNTNAAKEHPEAETLYASCVLFQIFSIIGSAEPVADTTSASQIESLLMFIHSNLDSGITLDAIAERAGLSKYHLCRYFKAKTGVTPMRYVLERRIKNACALLATTDISVSDIAMRTGFSSFSSFCRAFRSIENTSPMAYRIDLRNKL